MVRLRRAIIACIREDLGTIGELTRRTEELIGSYNEVAITEQGRGVNLPLIDASEFGA